MTNTQKFFNIATVLALVVACVALTLPQQTATIDGGDVIGTQSIQNAIDTKALIVRGASSLRGAVEMQDALSVTGPATFADAITTTGGIVGPINSASALTVTGAAIIGGAATITGVVTSPGGFAGNVTGNVTGTLVGNTSGTNATYTTITGTLATSTQTNVTRVGTLAYLTVTNPISMAGATFTGPMHYGTASGVISGSLIAHGFAVTPTMFIPRNFGLQGTTFTQTLYASTCNTVSCTIGIGGGAIVTFTVSWVAGQ